MATATTRKKNTRRSTRTGVNENKKTTSRSNVRKSGSSGRKVSNPMTSTSAKGWNTETIEQKLDYNDLKDFVHDLWDKEEDNFTYEPDKTSLKGNVAYTIVNRKDNETGKRETFIGVTLLRQRKDGDEYTISHKTMTEHESPAFASAPVSYIKRLGGVDGAPNRKARKWRENVLEYAEKDKELEEIKESGEKVAVQYGKNVYNVAFNHDYRRWIVEGKKDTYIPSKFVKPETVQI